MILYTSITGKCFVAQFAHVKSRELRLDIAKLSGNPRRFFDILARVGNHKISSLQSVPPKHFFC